MARIGEPQSAEQWAAYYELRWRILREPWGQPRGSERDEIEQRSLHLLAVDVDARVLGVGRLHFNTTQEAQVRFMAVAEAAQGRGVGSVLLRELETHARERGARALVLEARDAAVPFYLRHGYEVTGEGKTLFGAITHRRMRKKNLRDSGVPCV